MAQVTLPADGMLAAVLRAQTKLQPRANSMNSAWSRQEQMLNDIQAAATWVSDHPHSGGRVALTMEEIRLIEPFLTPQA